MPRVWLIRHADAGNRGEHGSDDLQRPLTAKGRLQAQALANNLSHEAIDEIFSSEAKRCVETITLLSERLGVPIQVDPGKTEGNFFDLPTSGNVVICAHGDNIPSLLNRLGLNAWTCAKASTWLIEHDGKGNVVSSEYADTPALD